MSLPVYIRIEPTSSFSCDRPPKMMRKPSHLFLIAVLAVALSGCFTHTVIGNGMGKASPDGHLTMAISCHGASRKAYMDTTKKHVYVWIMTNNLEKPESLFNGHYVFTGACLDWSILWQGASEVTVDFHDFGDRVSDVDAKKAGIPSNHIATLSFVLD